jgi:hypothetical protein
MVYLAGKDGVARAVPMVSAVAKLPQMLAARRWE